MYVQELLDILNNREEIPDPEIAELCFFVEDENRNEVELELCHVGAFTISTDITIGFKQIPVKPKRTIANKDTKISNTLFRKNTTLYYCTNCNKWVRYNDNYCRYCGQKLDWEV